MNMKKFLHSRKKGFTLVELLVGMTIFTVGITSIFLLLESTFKSASISRNEIIVANLLREQIELIRNLKENNYKNFAKWDLAKITDESGNIVKNSLFEGNFLVENNFDEKKFEFDENWISKSPIKIIQKNFNDNDDQKIFEETRLCFNSENFYTHCNGSANEKKTSFASYIKISEMKYDEKNENSKILNENNENQAYIIEAFVINKNNSNYRKYDAKTIITNWMK